MKNKTMENQEPNDGLLYDCTRVRLRLNGSWKGEAVKYLGFIAFVSLLGVSCNPTSESCLNGQTRCDGICVEVQTSEGHCGGCDTVCGAGQSCINGACACEDDLTQCSSSCVDTTTATSHCGECDASCAEGQLLRRRTTLRQRQLQIGVRHRVNRVRRGVRRSSSQRPALRPVLLSLRRG